jgi:hypothetical protein
MIYRDGRISFSAEPTAAAAPAKRPPSRAAVAPTPAAPRASPARAHPPARETSGDAAGEPVWQVRALDGRQDLPVVRISLRQIRDLVLMERLNEDDQARVMGGEWASTRSYPAIAAFFAELIQGIKEKHGDERHCALHPERVPGWRCHKCLDYLCQECVLNEPLVAGGADHWVCAACRAETTALKKKSAIGKVLFKKM